MGTFAIWAWLSFGVGTFVWVGSKRETKGEAIKRMGVTRALGTQLNRHQLALSLWTKPEGKKSNYKKNTDKKRVIAT